MHKAKVLGCGMLAAALIVGCSGGSSDDATMKESISMMNEMAALMESAKDEKSAKELEGKMKAFKERGEALKKKIDEFPKERLEALTKKYEAEGKAARQRLMNAMMGGMKMNFKMPK